ncbi:thiolase family protein [Phenylobacterium sp.]|uniref:thiolase family protein n=1 Tax=Phenylobacterium sp. TaxID=1871053 RepID=UPI002F4197A0
MSKTVVISGVGRSTVGRKLGISGIKLAIESIADALEDSGLSLKDIDGVSTWPGQNQQMKGTGPVGVPQIKEALRLELNWFSGGSEAPGQLGAFINAYAAIEAGLARHVVVIRTVVESTAQAAMRAAPPPKQEAPQPVGGPMQWLLPFHAFSPTNWFAQHAAAHFAKYGTTREQLGQIALNGRRNALLNPVALMKTPLTMDEYLSARMISTPFCLLDCDQAADGSVAVILSHRDAAKDLKHRPITVESVGGALHGRDSIDQFVDMATMEGQVDSARMMWARTDLKPKDVDFGAIYDGFSFLTLAWLEALGFCGRGEGGAFIEGGHNISREGILPINTDGGQLSGVRLHGYGFLYEACKQLWGDAGERQLTRKHQVAAVAVGGGSHAACTLLTL